MDVLVDTIARSLALATPLIWAALGEVIAERGGVVNLGVEGLMSLGALASFAVAQASGNPWLGLLAGILVGGLAAGLHAFVAITLRANQYVSGLALTMSGLGLAGLLGKGLEGQPLLAQLSPITLPGLAGLPIIGPILAEQSPLTDLGLLAGLVLWIWLFRSRAGLILRAVGEAPAPVDAAGLSVTWLRYRAVIFGGLMSGVAGSFLALAYRPAWTEGMSEGLGWIALAITILAAWNPLLVLPSAVFFGALYHLSFRLQDVVAPELLKAMPYAAVVFVLTFNALTRRRRGAAPAALGTPYVRGER